MRPTVTFKWADEQHAQPVERALAAQMIRGNRRSQRERKSGARVYFHRGDRRTVIVAAGVVGTIERSKT